MEIAQSEEHRENWTLPQILVGQLCESKPTQRQSQLK
jgi:hypothetical protein